MAEDLLRHYECAKLTERRVSTTTSAEGVGAFSRQVVFNGLPEGRSVARLGSCLGEWFH